MPILDSDELDDDYDAPPEEVADSQPEWLTAKLSKRSMFGHKDSSPKRRPGRRKNLKEPLANNITFLGSVLAFARPITGIAMTDQADDIAEALNDLAKTNDRLYAVLEKMTGGSLGMVKLIGACAPVAAAAYIETGATGMLSMQAANIMEHGLSESAVNKITEIITKRNSRVA